VKTPLWLTKEVALKFHARLLEEFGGAHGLRDEGLLDSALGRPQHLFIYGKPTMFQLAASYASALVRNHPFVDGNKRIGFACAVLFLEINGYRFVGSEADAVINTLGLAARKIDEAAYAKWLRANSKRSH
jgi:death-on-curing protein